jgi:hypothetical protein
MICAHRPAACPWNGTFYGIMCRTIANAGVSGCAMLKWKILNSVVLFAIIAHKPVDFVERVIE